MIERLSLSDVHALARDCLVRAGAPDRVAQAVAAEVTAAEAAGERPHGLEALLRDLRLMRYGRILAAALPNRTSPRPAVLCCDAGHGFAAAALAALIDPLADLVRAQGIAMVRLDRASDPGAMMHMTRTLAGQGLILRPFDPDQGPGRSAANPPSPMAMRDGQPPDSPLGGPVGHRAVIIVVDGATTAAPLVSAEIPAMIAAPPAARDIAFPTDLLERIVTA